MMRNLKQKDLFKIRLNNVKPSTIRYELSFVDEVGSNIVSYVIARNLPRNKHTRSLFNEEWDTVEIVEMKCNGFEEQCRFFMKILDATAYQHLFLWDRNNDWGKFHNIMGIQIDNQCCCYYSYLMEGGALLLNERISEILNDYKRRNNSQRQVK